MRTQTINNSDIGITNGTVSFPNEYSFVFNPNYVIIDANSSSFTGNFSVNVEGVDIVTSDTLSYMIDISAYKGQAKVYVSRLMQLMFCDYIKERFQILTFRVYSGSTLLASMNVKAIWGGVKVGDLFGGPGALNPAFRIWSIPHKREVKWFRNFPFTVSILKPTTSDFSVEGKMDNEEFKTISETNQNLFELNPTTHFSSAIHKAAYRIKFTGAASTFDDTFDYTFHNDPDGRYELVNIEISDNDTEGCYLRWIDRFGFLEYWLFVKGDKTTKLSYGSNTIDAEQEYEGINFGGMARYTEVKSVTSIKCSAVNLTPTQLLIVETVCESSHVDLYCGKDKSGTELWLPVNIASGSYKSKADTELQDLEVTITLPQNTVQKI